MNKRPSNDRNIPRFRGAGVNVALMKQIFIRDGELFVYQPKTGGYPDLYNHLFGL